MKRFTINIIVQPERRRRDSFWFDGHVATVIDNKTHRTIDIHATGHIDVIIEDQAYHNQNARDKAMELRYSDTKLSKLEWNNSNWFTLYDVLNNGQHFEWIPDTVAGNFEEAIRMAKHYASVPEDGPFVEVKPGHIAISDIIDGVRVHEKYIGHSVMDAKKLFRLKYKEVKTC